MIKKIGYVCLLEEQCGRSAICKEYHRWCIALIGATDL
jgi:hypothetical protein